MKRILGILSALFLVSAVSLAQVDEVVDVIYEIVDPPTVLATHAILSAEHSDSVVATPVLGDLLYFNGTGWARLGVGLNTQVLTLTAGAPAWEDASGGGGGAPTDAKYIVQTADATLSAEQAMGALGTGLVINTTTTGIQSIYAGATCTNQFVRVLSASGAATCASIANADITNTTIDLTTKVTGTLPVGNGGTGITSLGTGVATFLGTPSSANLKTAITDETGSGGALVFATAPALTTPNLISATATSGLTVNDTSAGPGYIDFNEDTDNGSNRVRLIGPASTADVTLTMPATTGTILASGTAVTVAQGGTGAVTLTNHGVLVGQATSAVAATGAGTAGQVLTSNGASADPTFQAAAGGLPNDNTTLYWKDEFTGNRGSASSPEANLASWTVTNTAGTAPGNTDNGLACADDNHQGVLGLDTGTAAAAGSSYIWQRLHGLWFTSADDITWIVYLPVVSTSADQYRVKIGFGDSTSGAFVDGAWFDYTDAATGAVWTINTIANSATTAANTATTVAAATWYRLRIAYEAGVGVHFYINGTETSNSPINTNLATTSARGFGPMAGIAKIGGAGINLRTMCIDHVHFSKTVSR